MRALGGSGGIFGARGGALGLQAGFKSPEDAVFRKFGPNLGPSWAPKILLYVRKFSQEASGSDPGALLKGVEEGPQHRRHSRSIFHRFWDRLGRARAPKNRVFVP